MLTKPRVHLQVRAYTRRGVASLADPGGRDKRGLNSQFSDASVRYESQHSSPCASIFTYLNKSQR